MTNSIKTINGTILQTNMDFRIELPTGGGWSIWNNKRDKTNQAFITDSQCGMVCRLYTITDINRDQPVQNVVEGEHYCIYAWWKDINGLLSDPDTKGWLTVQADKIVRADPDAQVRSAFAFLIPSGGQISGLSSYALRGGFAGNLAGEVIDLEGAPTFLRSGNDGVSPFHEFRASVIQRNGNYTSGGYWITIY